MCFCTNIQVERVEVKDVSLPVQLQRAMAAEAEASREARAKVVAAEGEQKASRALKEASDIISASASAMQLRYGYCYKKYSFLVFFAVCPKRTPAFFASGSKRAFIKHNEYSTTSKRPRGYWLPFIF